MAEAKEGMPRAMQGVFHAAAVGAITHDHELCIHTRRGEPRIERLTGAVQQPGVFDLYALEHLNTLSEFEGRIILDWGDVYRARIQRAAGTPKQILEIQRRFEDPPFPGPQDFVVNLSRISSLPQTWQYILGSYRGIYALKCPNTNELYVGSAAGAHGFLGRWLEYAVTGYNVKLKSRGPSDFLVSILETVGSNATLDDILAREVIWKQKLRPCLNGN